MANALTNVSKFNIVESICLLHWIS